MKNLAIYLIIGTIVNLFMTIHVTLWKTKNRILGPISLFMLWLYTTSPWFPGLGSVKRWVRIYPLGIVMICLWPIQLLLLILEKNRWSQNNFFRFWRLLMHR